MLSGAIKVSVIIPVYNAEKYLIKCLKSVSRQTLGDIEIIVIDDGSTDNSWNVIKEFANNDSRVVALHQNNKGVSAARNLGLKVATGEYIGFIDADDYIDQNYFEALYTTAHNKHADISSGFVITGDKGRQDFYNRSNKQSVKENKQQLRGVVWLNIYKNSLLRENKIKFLPKLRTAEDNLFNLQASYYANKIESIPEGMAYYHHVTRSGSLMTQRHDAKSLLLFCQAILETVKLMNSMSKYKKDAYILRLYDTLNFLYVRFNKADKLNRRTRLKISNKLIYVYILVRYRKELSELISSKHISLEKLMYSRFYKWLYRGFIVNYKRRKFMVK